MKYQNCHYDIDKKVDDIIKKEIMYEISRNEYSDLIIYNGKPYNSPNFYNTLDEELKKYCIQSFTCLDTNIDKPIYFRDDLITLSVSTKINELRLKYYDIKEHNKDILNIIKLSKNYSNFYSWLDSLEINELYKYMNNLKIKDSIDMTFDNNYFIKKLIFNDINIVSLFYGKQYTLIECVNDGLVEFCIKYETENMQKFVKFMLDYIYSIIVELSSLNIENKIRLFYNLFDNDFSNYLEYSKYLIESYKNLKESDYFATSEVLIKHYLDKFEKCYNYLLSFTESLIG